MRNVQRSAGPRKLFAAGIVHRRTPRVRVQANCPCCNADAVEVVITHEPATYRGGVALAPDSSDAEIVAACSSCGTEKFTKDERAMIVDHAWELFRGLAD